MPYGPYRDVAMVNVPADYLLHLKYEGCTHPDVSAYIDENMEVLLHEVQQINDEDPSDRHRDL